MDIVIHIKKVFIALTDFGNSIPLSSTQRFSTKAAQNEEQNAPNINVVNWYCARKSVVQVGPPALLISA